MTFTLPTVEPCPFCLYAAGEVTTGAGTGVKVIEDELAFAFVNPRGIQPGHLLVVPRRHAATILDLSATLGVDYLISGASQRNTLAKLLGGSVVTSVAQQLPDSIRLVIFG